MAKILVVDDEEFVRELIRAYLRGGGHSVTEAADGQEALEAFLRRSRGPHHNG